MRLPRILALCFLCLLASARVALSEPVSPWFDRAAAFEGLQAEQTAGADRFVVQGELDPLIAHDGGGACATARTPPCVRTVGSDTRRRPSSSSTFACGRFNLGE
jgi:hypothetical protein